MLKKIKNFFTGGGKHPEASQPSHENTTVEDTQLVINDPEILIPLDPKTPISDSHVRFVCISDTHEKIEDLNDFVPVGDVLLHAGDITDLGAPDKFQRFNDFIAKLPHKYKVVIAGNHDSILDNNLVENNPINLHGIFGITKESLNDYLSSRGLTSARELLPDCTYLQDSSVQIYGINIHGTPWLPSFGGWAFNVAKTDVLKEKYDRIPEDTDILITHAPALGFGDKKLNGVYDGCGELIKTIQNRVKPKYHVFGHIHEGYGMTTDGHTVFINAATCNPDLKPVNSPIVFDYPVPEGYTKS